MKVRIKLLEDTMPANDKEFDAEVSTIKDLASSIIKLNPQIPSEAGIMIKNISNPITLTHFISSNLNIETAQKQALLEIEDMKERARVMLRHLDTELQMLEMKNQIQTKVRADIDKQQREYFLQPAATHDTGRARHELS
jgi:ATP-dependent Lon protease